MQPRISDLPIIGGYGLQRFTQFDPSDIANWFQVQDKTGKKGMALYPTMGRRHINFLGLNRLQFAAEPRMIAKSVNYWYVTVVNTIFRIDQFYNIVDISEGKVTTFSGDMFSDYLAVSAVSGSPSITYVVFTDGQNIYVYQEENGTFDVITDPNAPPNPTYVAAFGNRFVVAGSNTSQFNLSEINLGGAVFNAATAWTVAGFSVFAQEAGIIKGLAVFKNQLYIFTDFTTGIWANTPSFLQSTGGTITAFPWKKNSSYDWTYGLTDALSIDVGFDLLVFLAKNKDGLTQVMASNGGLPKAISDDAIEVLFQRLNPDGSISPFLKGKREGFLYSYEGTVFYRLSVGDYDPTECFELQILGNSIEYNFNTQTWHRVIEKNGQRNRIQKHVFFNNQHLVSILGEGTIYQMSGHFYDNEIRNSLQESDQEPDTYLREPMRYERIMPILADQDYGENIYDFVEIDFVWGVQTFVRSTSPFENAIFLIDEDPGADGEPQFIIAEELGADGGPVYILAEGGNFPVADSPTYLNWFKPHIELYFSDDGGVSYHPADVREFSQIGVYEWRMRWFQLGASRNRVYKLICVSPSPIVILGGMVLSRRASSGGY